MNDNIEVIIDNSGGVTIQNTETKAVCYFEDIHSAHAIDALDGILNGSDMSDFDESDPSYYIEEEDYQNVVHNGGGISKLDESELRNYLMWE
jgi:hypothetical protein